MKLVGVVLLSLVALVSCDTSYQNYQNYQPYDYQSAPANNYYQPAAPSRSDGITGFLRNYLTSGNRRQFLGGFDIFSIIIVVVAIGFGLVLVTAAVGALNLNSSGRGLDTDEWEVDHSVWMNQLQKDFEESWNTE